MSVPSDMPVPALRGQVSFMKKITEEPPIHSLTGVRTNDMQKLMLQTYDPPSVAWHNAVANLQGAADWPRKAC